MIRVYKNLKDVPNSLRYDRITYKLDSCIQEKKYKKKYKSAFKDSDTKELLSKIYNGKCAFCEQKIYKSINNSKKNNIETIEHYRPKGIYYWLAFSWDNLLWCCKKCNDNKGDSFEILNTRVEFENSFKNFIHTSTNLYQDIEKPLMINPEFESILTKLTFDNGIISSKDERVQYTIKTCVLDRPDLNEKRLKIIEKFKNNVKKRTILNKEYTDILENLKQDFMNEKSEFRALKFWILKHHKSLVEENLNA